MSSPPSHVPTPLGLIRLLSESMEVKVSDVFLVILCLLILHTRTLNSTPTEWTLTRAEKTVWVIQQVYLDGTSLAWTIRDDIVLSVHF